MYLMKHDNNLDVAAVALAEHLWDHGDDCRKWEEMVRYAEKNPVSEQAREVGAMRQTAERAAYFLGEGEDQKIDLIIELRNQLEHNQSKLATGSGAAVLNRANAFLKELGL